MALPGRKNTPQKPGHADSVSAVAQLCEEKERVYLPLPPNAVTSEATACYDTAQGSLPGVKSLLSEESPCPLVIYRSRC